MRLVGRRRGFGHRLFGKARLRRRVRGFGLGGRTLSGRAVALYRIWDNDQPDSFLRVAVIRLALLCARGLVVLGHGCGVRWLASRLRGLWDLTHRGNNSEVGVRVVGTPLGGEPRVIRSFSSRPVTGG